MLSKSVDSGRVLSETGRRFPEEGIVSRIRTRINQKPFIWFAAVAFFALSIHGQSKISGSSDEALLNQRYTLISEVQSLGARAKLLDAPLARALAQTEVADAAWFLDQDLATRLLRESFGLTLPSESDPKPRRLAIGSPLGQPAPGGNGAAIVRFRILQVARRDPRLLKELANLNLQTFGGPQGHEDFADLAHDAIEEGDLDAAGNYIRKALDADPTQSNAAFEIGRLAAKDRAAADLAIIEYINCLRSVTLSPRNGSSQRAFFSISILVLFPSSNPGANGLQVPPPGANAVRTAIAYMFELMNHDEPTVLRASRGLLLASWPLVQQDAPELRQQFFDLEMRSRSNGDDVSLPTANSLEREYKEKFAKRADKELESDQPDALVIQRVISLGDFVKARKLIDKLADGPQKTELTEMLYAQQAISLANQDDISGALKLAASLAKASSILRVFPVIAERCAKKDDDVCARDSVNQAVRQLKKADLSSPTPPPGVPASFFGTKRDIDRVLSSLGSLTAAVLSVKDELALDIFDEFVIAANHSDLDTSQARTGFETSLIKKLADKNEERTTAAALQFRGDLFGHFRARQPDLLLHEVRKIG